MTIIKAWGLSFAVRDGGFDMNVLITGGAGFIGSHLVEYHLNQEDNVLVIDDLSTGYQKNVDLFKNNPKYQFIHDDICVFPDINKVVCWADRIYHMAAVVGVFRVIEDVEKLLLTNINGTERLLQAAKESKREPRILLASTSEVYGDGHGKSSSEESDVVISDSKKSRVAYAISKLAMEAFGLDYYEQFGIGITILRLFNTIGPRQSGHYGMVVPRFVAAALKNEPIVVYGTGDQTRSFVDVRDVVPLMDRLARLPEAYGEIVNLGKDAMISINDLALLIKKLAKSNSIIQNISYEEAYGTYFQDFMFRRPDLTKLHRLIGNHYEWTLDETIGNLVDFSIH